MISWLPSTTCTAPPACGGLPLQPVDQPEEAEDVRAAVGEVAGEGHVAPTAGPAQRLIHQPGGLEPFHQGVVLAVGVSQDVEGVHAGDGHGRASRWRQRHYRFVSVGGVGDRAVAQQNLIGAPVPE
jgi:hypothetical protein